MTNPTEIRCGGCQHDPDQCIYCAIAQGRRDEEKTNPTEKALPEFPEALRWYGDGPSYDEKLAHERARADAWKAIARLAVKHMRHEHGCDATSPLAWTDRCTCGRDAAAAAIGELPPEGRE